LFTKEEPGSLDEAKNQETFQFFLQSWDTGKIGNCSVSYLSILLII
jgi:hypothetical protein